jgi:hypothetical protein
MVKATSNIGGIWGIEGYKLPPLLLSPPKYSVGKDKNGKWT